MRLFFASVALISFVFSSSLLAQKLPTRALGLAIASVQIPYYRGSSANRKLILPLPLAIYREDRKRTSKVDKLKWFEFTKTTRLALSVGASLPVPASIRQGMPALNATLELGPKLVVDLQKRQKTSWSLHLPIRAVSTLSGSKSALQGYLFSPYLTYNLSAKKKNEWNASASVGVQYSSRRIHSYYYDVTDSNTLQQLPSFAAKAGYSGSRFTLYLQKSVNRLWLSAFAKLDYLSGSRFVDSPLVQEKSALTAGFVVGWVFASTAH